MLRSRGVSYICTQCLYDIRRRTKDFKNSFSTLKSSYWD
ncbi:hypothetical protein X975_11511, partial [Stegodyphus mimosarum]